MSNVTELLDDLVVLDGALCAAVVDSESGMIVGQSGSGVDLDIAAAGSTEVVRAKLKMLKVLGHADSIDDILVTLTTQHHIIRPLASNPSIFLYLVLDKSKSNLALARYKVAECDSRLAM